MLFRLCFIVIAGKKRASSEEYDVNSRLKLPRSPSPAVCVRSEVLVPEVGQS